MQINGEYTITPKIPVCEAAVYTWQYVLETNLVKLFHFTVKDYVLKDFEKSVTHLRRHMVDEEFSSLKIMEQITKSY
jgi:hypothetical protein